MLHRRVLAALVTVLILLPRLALAGTDERWSVLLMQGHKAGHSVERRTDDAGRITTDSSMTLTVKRGALSLNVAITSRFVETDKGEPISVRTEQSLGAEASVEEWTFTPAGIDIRTTQGPTIRTEQRPRPTGDWLTPAAAERALQAALAKGDTTITLRMLDPTISPEPVTLTRTLLARQPVEVMGRATPGIKWRMNVDGPTKLEVEDYTDEQGRSVRSITAIGELKIEQLLADKDLALAPVDAPELMMSTLVKPDKAIGNPRMIRSATYIVKAKSGPLPDLPSVGAQTFERLDPGSGRVTIRPGRAAATTHQQVPTSLNRSRMIDPGDAAINPLITLARLTHDMTDADKVERLRRTVHHYITKKDLSVGFASSSEVARTRTGDCTEHAVLLAALLRHQNIPARVVSGLLYVEELDNQRDVFGYHMWTQALVTVGSPATAQWIDTDAVMPDAIPTDATHIALIVSDLADDQMQNFMVTSAPLIGTLDITVEHTEQP